MSSSDPSLPEPNEPDPRENSSPAGPSWDTAPGSPFDRPRNDLPPFSIQTTADAPGYPDFSPDEPRVLPPPRKPHPHLGWAILWTIGFVFVSQVVGGFAGLPLGIAVVLTGTSFQELAKLASDSEAFQRSPEFAQIMWPTVLVSQLFGILFGIVALRFIAGPTWPRKVALRLPSLPHLAITVLMLPGFILVADGVNVATRDYVPSLGGLESLGSLISNWPWWLGILLIGVGPGIGEELFCRGFLGRGLVGSHGVVLGVIFTSVLFGVMHVEPQQVIYAPVMGVLLHFVYLTTRSLLLPMLLHTLNNSTSVLEAWAEGHECLPSQVTAMHEASHQASYLFVYAGAVVLLAAALVGLYFSRARLAGADGGPPPWCPGYPSVEYPPAHSGTVVSRPSGRGLAALGLTLLGLLAFVACCFAAYQLG